MAEEEGSGLPLASPAAAGLPGEGLGVADGLIAGNRPEASPAPMSWLEMPFRSGIGPSGSVVPGDTPGDDAAAGELARRCRRGGDGDRLGGRPAASTSPL